jgi:DnaJ-class molecular chaperone
MSETTSGIDNNILILEEKCPFCDGTGIFLNDTCQDCRGDGQIVTDVGHEILSFVLRRVKLKP